MYETLEEAAWEARHQKVPTWYVSNPQTKTRIKLVGRPPVSWLTNHHDIMRTVVLFSGRRNTKSTICLPLWLQPGLSTLLRNATDSVPNLTKQVWFTHYFRIITELPEQKNRLRLPSSSTFRGEEPGCDHWDFEVHPPRRLKHWSLKDQATCIFNNTQIHICIFVIETNLFGRNYMYSSNTWDVNISCHYDIDIVDSNCLSMLYTVWMNSRTREFGFYNVHHSLVLPWNTLRMYEEFSQLSVFRKPQESWQH